MSDHDASVGEDRAFAWKVYGVSAHDKAPLLDFVWHAPEMRGCKVLHLSAASRAPFHAVFEMAGRGRICGHRAPMAVPGASGG
jgi:hypothetical protein